MTERSQIRGLHSGLFGYKRRSEYGLFYIFQKSETVHCYQQDEGDWALNTYSGNDPEVKKWFSPTGELYEIIDDSGALELLYGKR